MKNVNKIDMAILVVARKTVVDAGFGVVVNFQIQRQEDRTADVARTD